MSDGQGGVAVAEAPAAAPAVAKRRTGKSKDGRKPRRITDNPELVAINAIDKILAKVPAAARQRVLGYVGQKAYEEAAMTQAKSAFIGGASALVGAGVNQMASPTPFGD